MFIIFWIIRDILLFPIRVSIAIVWFFWSLVFGGIYPGCAPLFWKNDRYIIYLKRRGLKYSILRYDLILHKQQIVYISKTPIERFVINNRSELICSSYIRGKVVCNRIILKENHDKLPLERYNFIGPIGHSRYSYVLLKESIGCIYNVRYCSDKACMNQIIKKTNFDDYIIDGNVDDYFVRLSVSNCEKYIAFSTQKGIYINGTLSEKQIEYVEGENEIFNWDNESNLLCYIYEKAAFLIINPFTLEKKEIPLSVELSGERIKVASISPNGNFIIYFVYRKPYRTKEDCGLILQCINSSEYKILAMKAYVFDVAWSKNEQYISIAGVNKRDYFGLISGYKMRNAVNHDKEILDIDGNIIASL